MDNTKSFIDDLSPSEIDALVEEEMADIGIIPGQHAQTFADLGLDLKFGSLTLNNTLSRTVFLSAIDSPFMEAELDDEITGIQAAEAAYILYFGPERLDHLVRWQLAEKMYPDDRDLAVKYRANFTLDAVAWFETIMEKEESFQGFLDSIQNILAVSFRAYAMTRKSDDDDEPGSKKN